MDSPSPSDLWFQNAQRLDDFSDNEVEEVPDVPCPVHLALDKVREKGKKKSPATRSAKKQVPQMPPLAPASYVITKPNRRACRLIKIEIIDLIPPETLNTDNSIVSAQYIVSDNVDDIMTMTESLVHKISKKICNESF